MHPGYTPVEVVKQPDGRLTCIIANKDGSQVEIKDNDQVCCVGGYVGICSRSVQAHAP
jgi:hypothetical protein